MFNENHLDTRHSSKGRGFRSSAAKRWDLAPCPICGFSTFNAYGIDEAVFLPRLGQRCQIVRCNTCGLIGPPGKSVLEACNLWNMRYSPEATADPEPDDLDQVFSLVRVVFEQAEKEGGIYIEDSQAGIVLFLLRVMEQYKRTVLEADLTLTDLKAVLSELVAGSVASLTAAFKIGKK